MRLIKKIFMIPLNFLFKISPRYTLSFLFLIKHGYFMSFNNPKSYNQKLNWLKLNYRDSLYKICADKYEVRNYIESIGLKQLLPKLLWVGNDPNDIPFNNLPNQFVVKTTHGSGNNIICTNKSDLDIYKTVVTLNKWLMKKYIPAYGEWVYDIKNPKIVVEEFLSIDATTPPDDFKIFCFNNTDTNRRSKIIALDIDRFKKHKRLIFDTEWKFLSEIKFDFPNKTDKHITRPVNLNKMLDYADIISKPFPHARIDFYNIAGKIYLGEITFFNGAGFDKITPKDFDFKLGNYIQLPKSNVKP